MKFHETSVTIRHLLAVIQYKKISENSNLVLTSHNKAQKLLITTGTVRGDPMTELLSCPVSRIYD